MGISAMKLSIVSVIRRLRHRPIHAPDVRVAHQWFGSSYGAWPIAVHYVGQNPIVFSFGVGTDISFDEFMIRRFGATIYAFDPTPLCREWIENQNLPQNFKFYPIGVAAVDGEAAFVPPSRDGYASFSKAPARDLPQARKFRVMSIESLIKYVNSAEPSIIKMDIEGFEYEVISYLVSVPRLLPSQLLVEFHHDMIPSCRRADTLHAVAKLRALGYKIFAISDTGREYGFIRLDEQE